MQVKLIIAFYVTLSLVNQTKLNGMNNLKVIQAGFPAAWKIWKSQRINKISQEN